jgi:tetratricopeptide (TPR) repeat protein
VSKHHRYRNLRVSLPLIAICVAPFLLGSVSPFVVISLTLCLLVSVGFESRVKRGVIVPKAVYGLIAILLVAAFGLLPLPKTLLGWLSPLAVETRDFVLGGLGISSEWAPLTFDIPATILAVLLCLSTLLAFIIGASFSTRTHRWRMALSFIGGLGGLMAFVVFAHKMNDLSAVYGLYPTQSRMVGPLINTNHLAALCSFSALIAVGLALHTSNAARPWLIFSALLSLAVVWQSPSRGGIAATLVGFFLLGLWELYAKIGLKALWLLLGVILAAPVGVLFWGGHLVQGAHSDIKFQVWTDSLSLARDSLWVGVGRGAFAGVFPRYQSFTQSFNVRSAEMLPLSIVSETGLLGLFFVLLFGAWFVATLRARQLEPVERGAVVALVMIILHDLADFSMDIAGIALPVFLVAGVLAGRAEQRRSKRLFIGVLALAVVIIPASLWAALHSTKQAASRLEAAKDREALRISASRELSLRPSDGFLALAAASRMLALQDPKGTMLYINRARYLLPTHYASHLLAARVLRQVGRLSQARLEYRGSYSDSSREVFREALEIAPGEAEMRQLIAVDESSRRALFTALQSKQRQREALNLLWGISQQRPDNPEAWSAMGEYALSAQEGEEAEAAAIVLSRLKDKRAPWLLARAKRAQGQPQAAREALIAGTSRWPRERILWLQLGEHCLEIGDYKAALEALTKAKQLNATTPDVFLLEAKVQEAQGRLQSALVLYQEALGLAPHDRTTRVSLARLYEKLGRSHDALIIYRELAKESSTYQAEVDRLLR